jgi:hypothetical protein
MAMLKQHACASFFRIDQLDSEIRYISRDSEGFWSCAAAAGSWMESGLWRLLDLFMRLILAE